MDFIKGAHQNKKKAKVNNESVSGNKQKLIGKKPAAELPQEERDNSNVKKPAELPREARNNDKFSSGLQFVLKKMSNIRQIKDRDRSCDDDQSKKF